jgi:hypothetical protein
VRKHIAEAMNEEPPAPPAARAVPLAPTEEPPWDEDAT